MKANPDMIQEIKAIMSLDGEDFLKETMTLNLYGYIHSMAVEKKEIEYYCPKPTFMDWLLGRKRRVKFTLNVKDVLTNQPVLKDSVRVYDVLKS